MKNINKEFLHTTHNVYIKQKKKKKKITILKKMKNSTTDEMWKKNTFNTIGIICTHMH